jgi:FKBP-type peptidyl-prolyl cis-trans isomerase
MRTLFMYLLALCYSSTVMTQGDDMKKETLPSGLQFEILQPGKNDAKQPKSGHAVSVHYTGWLNKEGEPGKKFDSSVDRNQPFKFVVGVGMVISGWDEGVLLMKVGEKRRYYIPANLAYGSRSIDNLIPANSPLIFDVELLDVKN